MAPTTTRPSNQPRTKTGPRKRALEDVRRTTTATIGTGLNATPTASGREWPIASPMRSPLQEPAALRPSRPRCHGRRPRRAWWRRRRARDRPSRTGGPLPHRLRLPTSSPLPERSRLCASGTGSARRAWKQAQLAAQPQVVADRPVLDGLPVLEADDMDLAEGDRLVGGGEPHELAGVASVEGAVHDHGVTFGDDLVDLKAPFRESLLDPPHGLDHAVQPRRRAGRGSMVDHLGVHHRPQTGGVAVGDDLLQGPPCDGLQVLGHDRLLPRRVRVTAAPALGSTSASLS